MNTFSFRGLEFHNNRMWKWESVSRALDFMVRFGFNSLIFHQNDLLDWIVVPEKYFTEEELWAYWPVPYAQMTTHGEYIRKVIREAAEKGISFYPEVKEIWYPEMLLDRFPHLRGADGHICPTDPFWFDYLEAKIESLLENYPDIAGLIVSPATRESKVTIAANQCTCERCRSTGEQEWYLHYLRAIHRPLAARGKTLVVRDFAYSTATQNAVLEAAGACSPEIVFGLKNVPHDFWPVFPHNPAIGTHPGMREWIEYDTWGQYIGLGYFPADLVKDIRSRFRHCMERGVSGVWCRTDWEILDEGSCFNSLNLVNLIGAGMLARDIETTTEAIYDAWVEYGISSASREESAMVAPVRPVAPGAAARLREFMEASYTILSKTLYIKGHVFNYSCRYQHALQSIYRVMNVYHQRAQWDPGSAAAIVPTEENLRAIFREKEEARELAAKLLELLQPDSLGIPAPLADQLADLLDLYEFYVEGFAHMARVYFTMQKYRSEHLEEDARRAAHENKALKEFVAALRNRFAGTHYPFYVCWMMDPRQLELLASDVDAALETEVSPDAI